MKASEAIRRKLMAAPREFWRDPGGRAIQAKALRLVRKQEGAQAARDLLNWFTVCAVMPI
jgi:hypothetical protein